MTLRRFITYTVVAICLVILISSVIISIAFNKLRTENSNLKKDLIQSSLDLSREIEEHRREERDRYFQSTQASQLESLRIRETIKEECKK